MGDEAPKRTPASIEDQANFVDAIVLRCKMHDGSVAGQSWVLFDADGIEELRALATRLRRMAPHENAIRRLVVGR